MQTYIKQFIKYKLSTARKLRSLLRIITKAVPTSSVILILIFKESQRVANCSLSPKEKIYKFENSKKEFQTNDITAGSQLQNIYIQSS